MNRRYKLERITRIEECDFDFLHFFMSGADHVSILYGGKFNWRNFNFLGYARDNCVWVCKKDAKPVGVMMARLYSSVFDYQVKIFYQDLLYVKRGSGRAAHILMRQFIDFGKLNANHLISCVAPHTNIKGRSLESLGFLELETQYRMEV